VSLNRPHGCLDPEIDGTRSSKSR